MSVQGGGPLVRARWCCRLSVGVKSLGQGLLVLAAVAALAARASAEQPVQPLPKPEKGQCPSGYISSGAYCSPMRDAKPALPKAARAQCPSGYYSSGSYCLASSREAREAVPRVGQCPSGYYSSGDYCLRSQVR